MKKERITTASDRIGRSAMEFHGTDRLADGHSPVHGLHPLVKLIVTLAYILTVVSFRKYDLTRLFAMILYPAVVFAVTGIPVMLCLRRMRAALPLVLLIGIANPFLDRRVLLALGGLGVSGGVISMMTLALKGVLCLVAAFLMVATTRIDALCAALRMLHVPKMPVTLLLLTFRYAGLMLGQAATMSEAVQLRAPMQRGIPMSAWGSFPGQLLLRSMKRAEELYESMQLRGFAGEYPHAGVRRIRGGDVLYAAAWLLFFALARRHDLTGLIGGLAV